MRHVDLAARPAPRFARAVDGWAVTTPAFPFLGFDRALPVFYHEADIASLWQAQGPAYDAEIARYRHLVTPVVDEVFAYLKLAQPPTEEVVVLPELLDAYRRGYGPASAPSPTRRRARRSSRTSA